MRKQLLLSLIAGGLVLPCQGGDIGLGVSMNTQATDIYVPWKILPHLKLEGLASFEHQHSAQTESFADANGVPVQYSSTSSGSSTSLGAGVFWLQPLTHASHLYMGPRIGFSTSKFTSNTGTASAYRSNTNGLFIAPTLGFEYFPIKALSLGGEIGVSYSKDHSSEHGYNQGHSAHDENENTFSKLILRYYF